MVVSLNVETNCPTCLFGFFANALSDKIFEKIDELHLFRKFETEILTASRFNFRTSIRIQNALNIRPFGESFDIRPPSFDQKKTALWEGGLSSKQKQSLIQLNLFFNEDIRVVFFARNRIYRDRDPKMGKRSFDVGFVARAVEPGGNGPYRLLVIVGDILVHLHRTDVFHDVLGALVKLVVVDNLVLDHVFVVFFRFYRYVINQIQSVQAFAHTVIVDELGCLELQFSVGIVNYEFRFCGCGRVLGI